MNRRDHVRRERRIDQLASVLSDAKVSAKQGLSRRRAKTHDHSWSQGGDFCVKPKSASFYLAGIRRLVDAAFSARLPFKMLHDVCQVDLLQINTRFSQQSAQKFSGWPDEWLALLVLPIAWDLPDQHDCRVA